MKPSHGVMVLLGAIITIAVYQALILPRASATARRPAEASAPPPPPSGESSSSSSKRTAAVLRAIAAKEKDIARLEAELQDLKTQGAAAKERVEQLEGTPQKWPDTVPAAFKHEQLEANIKAALAKHDLGDLVDVRCDEYPCLAVVRAKDASSADWSNNLKAALGEMTRNPDYGSGVNLGMWSSAKQDGDKATQLSAVSLAPPDSVDDGVMNRTNHRAQAALSDVGN